CAGQETHGCRECRASPIVRGAEVNGQLGIIGLHRTSRKRCFRNHETSFDRKIQKIANQDNETSEIEVVAIGSSVFFEDECSCCSDPSYNGSEPPLIRFPLHEKPPQKQHNDIASQD